jgi:iron complex outermembrane recepter protein
MNRGVLITTTVVGALLVASSAIAQTDGSTSKTKPGIETVIVTGSRPILNAIPMQAPYTESSITPEAILNITPSPATTVQTLLNTQPSIYATTGATNGMETDVKFRSFSDGEFGETIAGVPLNDIFNSGVTYQADNRNNALFITRDLDSVDIYRGVNNPAVNTYNSLGGTINYIPRQPTDEMGGDVGVDGGSFNTLDYHATFNTGDWHGIRQTISFERDFSSGWLQNTPDWNDNIYYAGNADINDDTKVFAYFIYNKNRGDAPQFIPQNIMDQQFDFQWPSNLYQSNNLDTNYLGIIGFKTEVAGIITVEDEAYGGDNNYNRTSFSNPAYTGPYFIDDQGTASPYWVSFASPPLYNPGAVFPYFGTQAYGVSTDATGWDCASNTDGCGFAGSDYHFYGYNGAIYGDRLKITADLPFNRVTIGGDFNLGELHSREYWYGTYKMPTTEGYNDAWDERDTRQMFSGYAQDDIHFWDDRVHVTPGLKYIGSVVSDNDALGFFYLPPGSLHSDEHFLSPTVGVSVQPLSDFTVYGSFGKNVKFPDITALYGELGYGGLVPPVTVKPEYVLDYELGARYRRDSVQVEANVYRENFSDIIYNTYPPAAYGAAVQVNGGSERIQGAELQLTDDFGDIFAGSLKGYVNASYNEAVCTSNSSNALTGGSCNSGQSLANIPNYLFNVGGIWDFAGWHVDLQGHYVGSQHLQDYFTGLPIAPGALESGQRTKIPSYFLFNVGIIKVIPLHNIGPAKALRLALHADNLFDQRYFSSAQVNTRNLDTTGSNQAEDFYGLGGEPRAVFGSIGVYF